jgi:hypothetical protein
MKKNLFLLTLVVILTTSFKVKVGSEYLRTGVYGCNCGMENPTKVELTLNDDFTFHYFDNYDPKKVIDIMGKWSVKNNKVKLTNYLKDFKIHENWVIEKSDDCNCLTSRKGLEILRLCNIRSGN